MSSIVPGVKFTILNIWIAVLWFCLWPVYRGGNVSYLESFCFKISRSMASLELTKFASTKSFLRPVFSFSKYAALSAIWFSFSLLASRDLQMIGFILYFEIKQNLCNLMFFHEQTTVYPSVESGAGFYRGF